MGNPYPVQIADPSGAPVRVAGNLTFTDPTNQPGGFSPVTCQLLLAGILDVSAPGNHPLVWDALQDNPWDENTLLAIPADLGMAFAFDGSDSTLTTTEAGTWALSLALLAQVPDDDWRGHYDDALWGQSRIGPNVGPSPQSLIVSPVMTLPVGAQLQPRIVTDTAAAVTQSFSNSSLILTRLA